MARIVLSQRMEFRSDYKDIPFSTYHFPKRYFRSINEGDEFVYYQGNRQAAKMRYYFGHGLIGKIFPDPDDARFIFSEILVAEKFEKNVPIWVHGVKGAFLEDLGLNKSRKQPPWQTSIRSISDEAFLEILGRGRANERFEEEKVIESISDDPHLLLKSLNEQYRLATPEKKKSLVNRYVDRGSAVVRALKNILGAKCQICGWEGFDKKPNRNGAIEKYIEGHHFEHLSQEMVGSLCSDNLILLCPDCHREVHHGGNVEVVREGRKLHIKLSGANNTVTPII